MGRQTRPVYICDSCNMETLEPRDVRKVIGNVSDGEGSHNYVGENFIKKKKSAITTVDFEIDRTIGDTQICSNMYCLKCLPDVLKINETEEDRHVVDLLKKRTETTAEKLIETAKEEILEKKKRTSLPFSNNEFEGVSEKLDDILDDFEEEEEEEIIKEEAEENSEELQTAKGGMYHVLGKIKDEQGEELIAKFYQFESVKDMREAYGGPLVGIYAGTGKYIDEIPECEYETVKVIVNAMMGIPNITDVECYANDTFAFIERETFTELIGEQSVE